MSKDKIEVNMNVYDIPIVIEELEKAEKEIKQLQQENQQLKKQKDDAIKLIHKELDRFDCEGSMSISMRISYFEEDLLRMLGEIE